MSQQTLKKIPLNANKKLVATGFIVLFLIYPAVAVNAANSGQMIAASLSAEQKSFFNQLHRKHLDQMEALKQAHQELEAQLEMAQKLYLEEMAKALQQKSKIEQKKANQKYMFHNRLALERFRSAKKEAKNKLKFAIQKN